MNTSNQSISFKSFLHKEKYELFFFLICIILSGYTSILSLTAGLFLLVLYYFSIRKARLSLFFSIDFSILSIALFITFCTNIFNNYSLLNAIRHPLPMLCAYLLGKYYGYRYKSEDVFIFLLFFLAIAVGLLHIIDTMNDIIKIGIVNPERRLSTMDEEQRAVTQRTTDLSLCIACFCMFFIPKRELKMPIFKYLYLCLSFIATICVLHYTSRTGVAILVITIFIGILYRWGLTIKSFIFILLSFITYVYFQESELFIVYAERSSDSNNIMNAGLRTDQWAWGLQFLWDNPTGQVFSKEYRLPHFSHNFWLDYGISYSLLSALLIAIFSIRNIIISINIKKKVSKNMSLILLTFSFVFFVCLFTEPIIYGAPNYLMVYLLFCGFVESLNKNS